ncbi:hypothetical protein MP638_004789 [Amoeboaphelidium occidentale]|nr:hypothetical protein MP638_004789 [Amoeboaphelidium occidentale]
MKSLSKMTADIAVNNEQETKKLPVTLLSGFLGAGKTTLLQRILTNKQNLKVAVIVNDMGMLNIDAALIAKNTVLQKEEKLVQLQNGCICCTLRQDLLDEVTVLAKEGKFDYLVIESSGISEPMQVAETFTFTSEELNGSSLMDVSRLDCCVTVVDATSFLDLFESADFVGDKYDSKDGPEAEISLSDLLCDQIEFSNVLILNKSDMVPKNVLAQIKGMLMKLNPVAKVVETNYCDIELSEILNTGLFDFEKAAMSPGWLLSLKETHTPETIEYGISSFVYKARKPFHPQRLFDMIISSFFLSEQPGMTMPEDDHDHGEEDDGEWEDEEEEELEEEDIGDEEEGEEEEEESNTYIPPEEVKSRLQSKKNGPFKHLLRSKGFIWIASRPKNIGEWSQAGLMLTISNGGNWFCELPEELWGGDENAALVRADMDEKCGDKRQELVLIGQFTTAEEKEAITKKLDSCLCTDEEMEQLEKGDIEDWEDPFEEWDFYDPNAVEEEEEEEVEEDQAGR